MSEQPKQEEAPPLLFEIAVTSNAAEWPGACIGVRPVLSAVQKLLEAAAIGHEDNFDMASLSLADAVESWSRDLFGIEDPPPGLHERDG
jgi:hypothetical protein